ncbi:MAG: D-alanyl-D-alanine carboxypeptidase family protein [Desulforhopalus sp.]
MKRFSLLLILCILGGQTAWAARAKVDKIAQDPYASALVIDADTGEVLFDDNAGKIVYPASVLKLMDLFIILEHLEQGKLKPGDMVQISKEAARMGGSQVYLDPKEQFTVEELMYALAVQSANDAAVALAIHVAGSTEGFIALMNRRAEELGMKDTQFNSVHGLPPAKGQKPDKTTARDLAILSRELAKRSDIFEYTGARERPFREGKFIMRNHNHLLGTVDGCDGFKTGYFQAAGFSIVATAKRGDVRIVTIVMGSKDRKTRDVKASELLAKGFAQVFARPKVAVAVSQPESVPGKTEVAAPAYPPAPDPFQATEEQPEMTPSPGNSWRMFFLGMLAGLGLSGVLAVYVSKKRSRRPAHFRSYR